MVLPGCGGGVGSDEDRLSSRVKEQPPSRVETTPETSAVPEPARLVETIVEDSVVTYAQAEAAYFEKCYDEAAEMFAKYTERKPENPWGHYMLGLSALKSGELETAEQAFDRTLELDPLHVKSWLNSSRVLLDSGRPEDALIRIDEALAIDPGSSDAYRLNGRALYKLERLEEAIEAYRHAIRLDDRDAWSMNNLGLILIEEERFGEALPPLALAVQLRDDIAVFSNNLGMALEHTGHYLAAGESYRSAVEIDESYEKAELNYSRVEEVNEDPGLATVDLDGLAMSFRDEIENWREEVTITKETDPVELDTEAFLISEADSIGGILGP
jgi:tetratricopeptide (TPR) repeat protein